MCIMYVSDLQLLLGNMLGEEYHCFQDVYMYVFAFVLFTGCEDTAGVCVYMCVCCLCGLWLIPRCVWGCVCSSRLVQYATSELKSASHTFWPEKLKIITI